MATSFKEELNSIVESAQNQALGRAKFYARSWKKSYDTLAHRGQKLAIHWIGNRAQDLEEGVEKVFWNLSRPIGLLTNWFEKMDQETEKKHVSKSKSSEEKKREELEIARFADEGGPAVESYEPTPIH